MRPSCGSALFVTFASLLLLTSPPAKSADHRDAPTIDDYSAIDINDVYMFRIPADCTGGPNCKLVVGLSTQAVADPLFGSSYHFQENALYRLNFTSSATGIPNVTADPTATIDFEFSAFAGGKQTYHATFPGGVTIDGKVTEGTPAATHLPPEINTVGNVKIFAGPREDPFFFDLVGFNRSIPVGANLFTGVDAFKGKNVNAIVIEMPVETVFPSRTCQASTSPVFSTPCGVWAVSYLANLDNDPASLRQVDRMGNPAVNTVLIPAAQKDAFNFEEPTNDEKFISTITGQILALDKRFGTCPQNEQNVFNCNPNVPLLASVAIPDILRFARNLPDGYPNGRRLFDRTTDVLLSLILQIPNFTDGTEVKQYCLPQPNKQGKVLPSTVRKQPAVFPYLGPPLQLDDQPSFKIVEQTCP